MNQVINLGYTPRPWQREFHASMKRWNVAVLHRRAGKTVLAAMELIDKALKFPAQDPGQEGRFDYLAPFREQAKDIAWPFLKGRCQLIPGVRVNEAELSITFPHNKARVRLYGANNDEALRGGYADYMVVDEAKDIAPSTWTEILLPKLVDRAGRLLMMGTPSGVNLLSATYYQRVNDPEWNVFLRTVHDTDVLQPDEVAMLKSSMAEASFAREFLCDFSAGAENTLLSVADVQAACGRVLKDAEFSFAPKVLGVDVARYGDDATVIQPRQGLSAHNPVSLRGADAMAVAGRVAQAIERWQPDAVFVDGSGGYGAGVIDRLRDLGHAPIEVQFGGRATDPRFANKRAEMWWEMADWVRKGGALPTTDQLRADLTAPTYSFANAAGKIALESKEEIKKRLSGFSPDFGDALALTFAYPAAPRGADRPVTEYDPLTYRVRHDYHPLEQETR